MPAEGEAVSADTRNRGDGHRLRVRLSDEGVVIGEVICPFENDTKPDLSSGFSDPARPCIMGDGQCYVTWAFRDIGMECFEGKVNLPDLEISYRVEGHGDDEELYIQPVQTQNDPEGARQ